MLLGLSLVSGVANAQRRPPPLPAPGNARPAPTPPKVNVVPAPSFPTDFTKLAALAGGGPYDLVLVAVRSRLPFEPKDGSAAVVREVYYAEALCRANADPGLKLLFYGQPLRVENGYGQPNNTHLRTYTQAFAPAARPDQPDGPLWETFGTPGAPLAKYRSDAPGAALYPYPHRYNLQAPTVDQLVYNDERQQVYEFKISHDLPLQAKPRPLPVGFVRTAAPQDAYYFLSVPKAKQTLVFPQQPPTADNGIFRYTVPGKTVVYGGAGVPQRQEIYAVCRTYAWQSATVRHHVPGKQAQRWLFVTADEVAQLVSPR
ncbi:hypothetical protein GCM10023186_05070 [Hymenobacter koreensis]|uniref:DUF3048 domain-containing protein n=1 Tax=Hymenobacter koreensis TaxID=1084523 RepID=A0ABP8IUG9_9BACT